MVVAEESKPLGDGLPGRPCFWRNRIAPRETAPRIVRQPFVRFGGYKSGTDGIEVDVVEERPQVQIAVAAARFDEDGLVAVAKESSPFSVSHVEAAGVGVLEPPHAIDKDGCGSLDEKVVVVAHQHPRPYPEAGALATIAERPEKEFFIGSIGRGEDGIAPVATGHHMVKGSLVFDTDLARHEPGCRTGWSLSIWRLVP